MTERPNSDLEERIAHARDGTIPIGDFLTLFIRSKIAVPSGGEVAADGSGFRPLLFDRNGVQMVACFTSVERAKRFSDLTPYLLSLMGADILRRMPSGFGLVINPDHPSLGMEISPDGLKRIVADFTSGDN